MGGQGGTTQMVYKIHQHKMKILHYFKNVKVFTKFQTLYKASCFQANRRKKNCLNKYKSAHNNWHTLYSYTTLFCQK